MFTQNILEITKYYVNISFNGNPVYPLKIKGKVFVLGWEIPLYYAVDNANQEWLSDGHGNVLNPNTNIVEALKKEMEYAVTSFSDAISHIEHAKV